ncbi:hypothetical protein P7K49_004497, partial [Saguinus oedipus]
MRLLVAPQPVDPGQTASAAGDPAPSGLCFQSFLCSCCSQAWAAVWPEMLSHETCSSSAANQAWVSKSHPQYKPTDEEIGGDRALK